MSEYPNWSLSLKTAPTVEPLTLDTVKTHCEIVDAVHDDLLAGLITASRSTCEAFTNRAIPPQTWYLRLDRCPHCGPIWIPKPPLTSITSINYVDQSGATQTWAATTGYQLSAPTGPTADYARVQPAYGTFYPITRCQMDAVTIEFVCGYASIPPAITSAMLLLIGHWFENREAVSGMVNTFTELPLGVQALLGPYVVSRWS